MMVCKFHRGSRVRGLECAAGAQGGGIQRQRRVRVTPPRLAAFHLPRKGSGVNRPAQAAASPDPGTGRMFDE